MVDASRVGRGCDLEPIRAVRLEPEGSRHQFAWRKNLRWPSVCGLRLSTGGPGLKGRAGSAGALAARELGSTAHGLFSPDPEKAESMAAEPKASL
jgi:hypothetical protein